MTISLNYMSIVVVFTDLNHNRKTKYKTIESIKKVNALTWGTMAIYFNCLALMC